MRTYKFNLFTIPLILFALWLGSTGRVPWWTVILVGATQCKIELTIKR